MTSWRRLASVPDGGPPLAAPGPEPVPVAVVSPYPATRAGLRVLLESAPAIVVVAEARTLAELAEVAPEEAVIVADPAGAGGAAPAAGRPAVVLLGPPDPRLLTVMADRPRAFLPADSDAAELAAAVQAVHAGLVAVHPAFLERLLGGADALPTGDAGADGPVEELTPRERQVLALLAEGLPNKTIARRLGISDHTVKFHVGAVLSKLGAASRTEAVRIGLRRGLIAL